MFKQALSLLIGMFLVFAFSASAQPPESEICHSITLLDAQGQPATQFHEGDLVFLRVVAPNLNFVSSLRDEAYMVLSAQGSGDSEALSAYETGPDTGVFERRIRLAASGRANPQDGRLQTAPTDHISVQCGAYPPVVEADVLGPTVHFLDAGGHETATVVTGFPIRLRAAALAANQSPFIDTVQVRLLAPGGDDETVTLRETGPQTGIFEGSLPLVEGTAVSGDATLQAAPVGAVEAQLQDMYGTTLATTSVTVAQRLLTFRDDAGAPLSTLLERAAVRVELLDATLIGPTTLQATAHSQIAGDTEYVILSPDPEIAGRFEGILQLGPYLVYPFNGNLTTYRTYSQPYEFDTVTVDFCEGCPTATATATTGNPEMRLLDAAGRDATVFAAGSPVRMRVVYPMLPPGYPETYARLESLTTGDLLSFLVLGATGGSAFEGQASTATGAAAADSILQVQPGEIVKATHLDILNQPSGTATARIQEATLEFTDAAGAPQSEFLIGRPVYLRAVDPTANANPAQAETLVASIDVETDTGSSRDRETLTLTETGPDTGIFAGSISSARFVSYSFPNGVLDAGTDPGSVYRCDVLHARVADASAKASTVQSQLRFVDAQGNDVDVYPMGSTVYVRLEEPIANQPGQQDQGLVRLHSLATGDWEFLIVDETGPNTGIFTGSIATGSGPAAFGGVLEVEQGETIEADHMSYGSASADRASFAPNHAPVVQNESVSILEDTSTTVDVLANDSDPDGQPLTVTNVTAYYGGGTVTINPDSSITFTPSANSFGYTEVLTYTVSDGELTATGTLSIEVLPVIDPPVAVDDERTTYEDFSILLSVLNNDSDPEGYPLEILGFSTPAHGTVEPHPLLRDDFQYIPAPDFNGTDSFTYTVRDVEGGTSTATVTISVEPVDDPPFILDDTATTAEDTAVTIAVLANDSDVDTTLTVASVSQPAHGSAVVNGGETVTYTPAPNFSGTDSFDYVIQLGPSDTAVATVTVTVTPVNDAPDAVNDAATTNEDTAVTVSVRSNDTDPENNTLTITAVTQGTKGTVTINGGATVTYTPNANANGSDSFTYTISDGNGGTDTATVAITITAVNDAPDAVNDSATTNEDTAVSVSVLGNDTDAENNTLTITAVTQGTKGSAAINGSAILYTPNTNANGSDSFTYTISDGNGGTDTATVAITITGVNDAPDAVNDSATTNEDAAVTISVRGNDTDLDNDTLTITAVTQGTKGTVTINGGATVTYTPNANANGSDSFTYTISDGNGGTDTATVAITITAVNDAPDAVNDSATTNEDTAVSVSVLGNDTDAENNTLTITAVTQGTKGSAAINGSVVLYTPNANANGSDSFTYTISDGNGGTDTATVSITITAVNDAPDAVNDSATTNEDTAVTVSVRGNDADPENDSLTITAVTQGTKGAVTINGGTTVTYTPNANANGSDSFTYTISDGNGGTDTATVAITINPVNDPPDAINDVAATAEDTGVTITVLANDVDVDGEVPTVTVVTQGSKGAVLLNGNGTVTYTPAANTNGADAFTYTIRDGSGATDTATVTVNVAPVNDAPAAVNDTATTREGAAVAITVLSNDSDIEGNALTVTGTSTPGHGSTSINSNIVTYTPATNFNGTDTFTYSISDGQGGTASATVTVTVKDALERTAILATHGVWIQTGADMLSGDVIVNQTGAAPFLDSGVELSIAGTVTTPAGYDVQANRINIAAGSTLASDAFYNTRTGAGSLTGTQTSPLTLPVFTSLPAFQSATPNTTDVNVSANGTRTLTPGNYRDLIVGKKGTVTFTGGIYHFRSIQLNSQVKLFFSAAAEIRVQQKVSTLDLAQIKPATGATIDGSDVIFYVAGLNGTGGGLAETPKAVEIGTDSVIWANVYAPNGTIWLKDRTQARGAHIGKDIQAGPDVQVTLDSFWTGQ